MHILFPANVMLFVSVMIPTVGFDVLESFFDWESQQVIEFNFTRHEVMEDEVFNQLIDVGYDSFNSIMLLQTIGIILFIYLLQVLFIGSVALFVYLSKDRCGGSQFLSKLCKKAFFGPLIELFI